MIEHKIDAIPFQHEKMDEWRDSLRKGVQNHHAKTNFIITGGVDDVWINSDGELIVVDYKATSKKEEVSLDADWQMGYKRQMSLYSWLFRQNGFKVSSTGYFVYCNGRTDRPTFNSVLEFKISVIPYLIDESWIEDTISAAHVCLNSTAAPPPSQDCDLCQYVQSARAHFG